DPEHVESHVFVTPEDSSAPELLYSATQESLSAVAIDAINVYATRITLDNPEELVAIALDTGALATLATALFVEEATADGDHLLARSTELGIVHLGKNGDVEKTFVPGHTGCLSSVAADDTFIWFIAGPNSCGEDSSLYKLAKHGGIDLVE